MFHFFEIVFIGIAHGFSSIILSKSFVQYPMNIQSGYLFLKKPYTDILPFGQHVRTKVIGEHSRILFICIQALKTLLAPRLTFWIKYVIIKRPDLER